VVGDTEIDARATPGEGAALTIVAIVGGVDMRVPTGAKISVGGFSFRGGRHVEAAPGDGPEIAVHAFTVLGGVQITDKESSPAGAAARRCHRRRVRERRRRPEHPPCGAGC
jgi:hypothetical protein